MHSRTVNKMWTSIKISRMKGFQVNFNFFLDYAQIFSMRIYSIYWIYIQWECIFHHRRKNKEKVTARLEGSEKGFQVTDRSDSWGVEDINSTGGMRLGREGRGNWWKATGDPLSEWNLQTWTRVPPESEQDTERECWKHSVSNKLTHLVSILK